jgi:hypothetical protein
MTLQMTKPVLCIAALVVLLGDFGVGGTASAAPLLECKACAAERKICRQAHSQQACDSEFAICMKHCQRK